jgi:integrase
MALYQRSDSNMWWMDFTGPDGKRVKRSTKTSNKQLAAKVEAKVKLDVFNLHQMGIAPDRPFKDAVDYYIEIKHSNRTICEYERQLAWWQEQFKDVPLQRIDEDRIVNAIGDKRKEGATNATCNRYLAVLRATLRAAHNRKWITRVPTFKLYSEPKERVRWLTDVEMSKLLEACPTKWRDMIRVSLATGLRQSNVRAMRWEWVDLNRQTLCIPGGFFKNGKDFAIPLPLDAVDAIQKNIGRHSEFVFVDDHGKPIAEISSKMWKATLQRAGIENFRWHDLRHTWASRMAQAGVPTQALQKLGGWQTAAMVNKYAHHDVESLRGFVEEAATVQSGSTVRLRNSEGKRHLRLVA